MIYIAVSKYDSGPINQKIIEWVRNNLQKKNINYKLIWCREYMFDTDISFVNNSDYIFWNPIVASKNLEYVKQFQRSIVIIERQTLLSEKVNKLNPINENLAVNNGFYIMYLNENDPHSREWKLAVQADNYLMRQKTILDELLSDKSNYREVFIERPDTFEEKNDVVKNQINYDE